MLPIKWVVFFLMAVLIGSTFSGLIEMTYLGQNAENATLAPFFSFYKAASSLDIGGVVTLIFGGELPDAFFNFFTWHYAMFTGGWALFRYLILLPLSAAMAITLGFAILSIIRGGGG